MKNKVAAASVTFLLKKILHQFIIGFMDSRKIKHQTFTHIPVYSGDVSGAASALYEFGGMTVIHDPSGCNSTYNTHDELRWSKRESAIYISGLRESDAVNGNDDRLINDTVWAALSLEKRPAFIALCNSPVPDIIGTDFHSIAKIIEKKSGIPTFYIRTNAMHDYTHGASNAFYKIAEKFLSPHSAPTSPKHIPSGRIRVSLLGLTPFEYPYDSQVDAIYDLLESNGFEIRANWGKGTAKHPVSFDDIQKAPDADVNLVLSSSGMKAAGFLEAAYGIPYIIGDPLVLKNISDYMSPANGIISNRNVYMQILGESQWKIRNENYPQTAFIGEPVTMGSEAAAYALQHPDRKVRLICTTETTEHLISHEVACPRGEAEIAESMMQMSEIHGDPLMKHATSDGVHGFDPAKQTWVDEPHLAMSGRMFI